MEPANGATAAAEAAPRICRSFSVRVVVVVVQCTSACRPTQDVVVCFSPRQITLLLLPPPPLRDQTNKQLSRSLFARGRRVSRPSSYIADRLCISLPASSDPVSKMKCFNIIMVTLLLVTISLVSSNETGNVEVSNRITRAANSGKETSCHYEKSPWSPCDEKTNVKTRTLTIKKGDDTCEKIKKIEKKCKKACQYIRGPWSKCNSHNEMIRTDTLRDPSTENSNCTTTRQITKKCKNKGRGNKGNKQSRNRQ